MRQDARLTHHTDLYIPHHEKFRTLYDTRLPVLLCWEDVTKEGQWCHRRIAAAWLERELGISVPEYEPILPQKSCLQLPLFDVS